MLTTVIPDTRAGRQLTGCLPTAPSPMIPGSQGPQTETSTLLRTRAGLLRLCAWSKATGLPSAPQNTEQKQSDPDSVTSLQVSNRRDCFRDRWTRTLSGFDPNLVQGCPLLDLRPRISEQNELKLGNLVMAFFPRFFRKRNSAY